ncbi:MAG TPA: phosphatase PAP2 family protein [Polyangiaceae bacterium]|nr:phosphatase PAP2 family protein [Polyangiaceae bacterium]
MTRFATSLAALSIALGFARAASADEPRQLARTDPAFLAGEFAGSSALALALSLGTPGAAACRWCDPPGFDASVRNSLVASDGRPAAVTSHVLALGLTPAVVIAGLGVPAFSSEHPSYALSDVIIVADATILLSGIGDFTKKVTGRERPAFHYGHQGDTEATTTSRYRSFFSLDTAWAFSIAGAGATLAAERGYGTAPWIAGAGAILGVTTGVLRMVADMHYLSDVAVGAAVGAGAGIAFPLLMHPPRASADAVPRASFAPVVTPTFVGLAGAGYLD